jgi:hypothetical protein
LAEISSFDRLGLISAEQEHWNLNRCRNCWYKKLSKLAKTIKQVDQSSAQMRQTVVVLQGSAETVRLNANKLQKLVGQFEVSNNSNGLVAAA